MRSQAQIYLDESFKVRNNTFGEGVIFMIPIQLDESAVGLSFSDEIILGHRDEKETEKTKVPC